MAQIEVFRLAEENSIAEKTLRNAKGALEVEARKHGNQRYWKF